MMKTILVIDDQEELRENIIEILELSGFKVLSAENGTIGLKMVDEHQPDLVICDIMMPELDGYGVLAHLRNTPETLAIPFIFLTAKKDYESQRQGIISGADDYLFKPFDFDELLAAVNIRLERHAAMMGQVSQQVEQFRLLRQLDSELTYRFDPEWVMTIMMDWILRGTNANVAILGTIAKHDRHLCLQYVHTFQTVSPPKKGDCWSLDEGFVRLTLESPDPLYVSDVTSEMATHFTGPNTKSALGLTLATPDSILGIVILESDEPAAFTQEQIDFLQQMANRTAIVLEHANLFQELLHKQQEELKIREMFGRFVSPDIAEAIQRGEIHLEGESQIVTVLFCDIRDFTGLSEQHSSLQVIELLNEFTPIVVSAIQINGGIVNKFGGDSILAIFGAPKPLKEHAYSAIKAGLQLQANLKHFNAKRTSEGHPPIKVGIGINTGEAVAGLVGAKDRHEYTVIGDTVNLSSRIQTLSKDYPDYDVLISDFTYQAIHVGHEEFKFVDLGYQEIRGKTETIKVWGVKQ